ncbi:MAG TPA: hypothetical protein PKY56_03755 [Candidatus Kapabacteria bacterium]|nr:hypothetical protein [Candidatus Kapabacteria bacterium]
MKKNRLTFLINQNFIKEKIIVFSYYLFVFLLILSCDSTIIDGSSNVVFPDSLVSFQTHVYPFMKSTCSYQGCHSDESQAGGIRLTDYFSYSETGALGVVVPYKPDNSRLVQKIEGTSPHLTYVYWKITDNQKKGIRQWILEGAKNN